MAVYKLDVVDLFSQYANFHNEITNLIRRFNVSINSLDHNQGVPLYNYIEKLCLWWVVEGFSSYQFFCHQNWNGLRSSYRKLTGHTSIIPTKVTDEVTLGRYSKRISFLFKPSCMRSIPMLHFKSFTCIIIIISPCHTIYP